MPRKWNMTLLFFALFALYLFAYYSDRDVQRDDDERYCAAVYLQQIPDYDKKYDKLCLSGTLKQDLKR